jgi:hypothetical protein
VRTILQQTKSVGGVVGSRPLSSRDSTIGKYTVEHSTATHTDSTMHVCETEGEFAPRLRPAGTENDFVAYIARELLRFLALGPCQQRWLAQSEMLMRIRVGWAEISETITKYLFKLHAYEGKTK